MSVAKNLTVCHEGADIKLPYVENYTVLAVRSSTFPTIQNTGNTAGTAGTTNATSGNSEAGVSVVASGTLTVLLGKDINGCHLSLDGEANVNTYNPELTLTISGNHPKVTLYHSRRRVVHLKIINHSDKTELLLCGRYNSVEIGGTAPIAKMMIDEIVGHLTSQVPTMIMPAAGRTSQVHVAQTSGQVTLASGVGHAT